MLLAIDIGNTNTVVGVFDNSQLINYFRVASRHNMTADEAGLFVTGLVARMNVNLEQVDRIVIGSVVPPLTPVYEQMGRRFFAIPPLIVSYGIDLPIRIDIEQPQQLGADRIANACGAYEKYGGPVIIVDFGTAINIDIVNEDGTYIGGVLAPGPETSMSALAQKAAKLFEVQVAEPDRVVGKSTLQALRSGLFYGTLGQIDFLLDKIIEETGFHHVTTLATGGLAGDIEQHSRHISKVEPTITLEGLRLIAERN